MGDLIQTLIPIIGELIKQAPGIIAAYNRGDEDAETRLRAWLETREDVVAASARWKAARD